MELIIKHVEDYNKAIQVLGGYKFKNNDDNRTINITIDDGVQEIAKVLTLIEQNQIQIESLSLHKPTLDDVFLQLTGHQAEEVTEEDK